MAIRRKVRALARPVRIRVPVPRRRRNPTDEDKRVLPAEENAKRHLARKIQPRAPNWPRKTTPKPRFDRDEPVASQHSEGTGLVQTPPAPADEQHHRPASQSASQKPNHQRSYFDAPPGR